LYAVAAGRYQAVLDNEGWVDDAGLAAQVDRLIHASGVPLDKRYVFAGFGRSRKAVSSIQAALVTAGAEVVVQPATNRDAELVVHAFEQRDEEMRGAGAWARQIVNQSPGATVAIVVQGLEQSARRDLRLVREGFVPGWQYGPANLRNAVNISYGQRLSEYPAIAVALLALRWLVADLSSGEVSRLLLSPLVGAAEAAGRARIELRLRELPDRSWTPSMITSALRGKSDATDAEDWLARIAALSKRRRELPRFASPAAWVMLYDDCLQGLGWPGSGTLDSDDYQLINRWRELLNEFARLELVSSSMSPVAAMGQLERMAGDTLFQPERRGSAVQLMGPLEASGGEFDAIWIAGLTANNWPPPGNPTPLVSRRLQVEREMPDASPEDTRAWAATTLQRLGGAASQVVCSYALVDDDVAQAPSDLLGDVDAQDAPMDPGWHASVLAERVAVCAVQDNVPRLGEEKIYGGAGTVQRQLSEPFSAFAFGRLGIRGVDPQAMGIPPLLRGNLIHDTLYRLYQPLPTSADLRSWDEEQLRAGVVEAAKASLQRHSRNTDPVLRQLLRMERDRIIDVVKNFVRMDAERGAFEVVALEGEMEFSRGNLHLSLRFDRVDRFADGAIAIIDYKTGAARQLLLRDGTVKEAQLFVYAAAAQEPVAMLALANLDSRETGFSGAGRGFTDEESWPDLLAGVGAQIDAACDDFIAGDVRLLVEPATSKARGLDILSRYRELRRGG
jgi:probable DNA repair protein